MGRPALVIIARHGARLDAADRSWHLTSPAPYDPPLTYGGWTQSRALGLRIANLLQGREDAVSDNHQDGSDCTEFPFRRRKRRHRVVIHTSPYLRCLETAIGISEGIAQFHGLTAGKIRSDLRPSASRDLHPSPRLHAVDVDAASVVARGQLLKSLREHTNAPRVMLRTDAFLGEWLSPDYFEHITPPPDSAMMLAAAKAMLLEKAEPIETAPLSSTSSVSTRSPNNSLWNGSKNKDITSPQSPRELVDNKQCLQALPMRDRPASYGSGIGIAQARPPPLHKPLSTDFSSLPRNDEAYTIPTPIHAVSPAKPIPKGFVAHARDACVDVDMSWDSSREPLSWGDGGEFGEEWSTMHKRLRRGLMNAIQWYTDHGTARIIDQNADSRVNSSASSFQTIDDEDEEIVVIFVTHGSGCNALIGALTEQPVLLDVGMASLTVAVEKPGRSKSFSGPIVYQPGAPLTTGLSQIYDMKIVASQEHLRASTDLARAAVPEINPPISSLRFPYPDPRLRDLLTDDIGNSTVSDSILTPPELIRGGSNASLGSTRRSSAQFTVPLPQRSGSPASVNSITGLWAPFPTPPRIESPKKHVNFILDVSQDQVVGTAVESSNMLSASDTRPSSASSLDTGRNDDEIASDGLNSHSTSGSTSPTNISNNAKQTRQLPLKLPHVIGRALSQKGLWGSAPNGILVRDQSLKRRWSVQKEADS